MSKIVLILFLFISHTTASQEIQRFAWISDYGDDNMDEFEVSLLVKSWAPKFIITSGDDFHGMGGWDSCDLRVGKYYHEYIGNYIGQFGKGADTNKFFPAKGNHPDYTNKGAPYYRYFTLPDNERYYDFVQGDIHFYVVNSEDSSFEPTLPFLGEVDGCGVGSKQYNWIISKRRQSVSPWNIIIFHHPPYISLLPQYRDLYKKMRWDFKEKGFDIVLTGHNHVYDRIEVDGYTYLTNGLGGGGLNNPVLTPPNPNSKKLYFEKHGAVLVKEFPDSLVFECWNVDDELIDVFTLKHKEQNQK